VVLHPLSARLVFLFFLAQIGAFSVSLLPARSQTDDATLLTTQIVRLQGEGRYSEAVPLAQRLLTFRETALGSDHVDVAASLNVLAELYRLQGHYADAEPLYKRSLAIREQTLGSDHIVVAQSLNNLAILYQAQGHYADAEPLLKRTLVIQEKVLGPDHPDVAMALGVLADLYRTEGRYAEAEPLYQRSLAILESTFGPDHAMVAAVLHDFGNLYRSQGRYADAELLYTRSLLINEKRLGPDHPFVAVSLNSLADLYYSQARYTDAEPLLKRSLAIREKILGLNHPDVAASLNSLANLYYSQARYADAEPLFRRSLAIRENVFGPDHPDVAHSLHDLANLNFSRGAYVDAEILYKRSLAINEISLGSDHPDVATVLNNLALLYQVQGRYADALPLVRNAAENGFPKPQVYLPVLVGAVSKSIMTAPDAIDEGDRIIQQTMVSAVSNSINQLSARFSLGSDELAQLVRRDQDLASESDRLDKSIVEAVSREPSNRDFARERQIRDRIRSIAAERLQVQTLLEQSFPNFAALAKPIPLSVKETQALLGDDEVLVILDFDQRSYGVLITRTSADGGELNITAKDVEAQVKALRASLTSETNVPFDLRASYRLYQSIFGASADKIASKKRLSVVTNGALTSIPLQLLVTKDPAGKKLEDIDWLVRSHAITILPSVASLKMLRGGIATPAAPKPMIAFADPVFSKYAKRMARQQVAMRGMTSFVTGTQINISLLAENLAQLPSTRDEVQVIAKELQVDPSDVKLGLDANVTAVKTANLDQYRIVYFATHGLVAGDLEKFAKGKVEPALALSIPDKPNDFDNGLLSASEVAQLKLNADWVVLSACNTAAEEEPGGEALSGLARAFFYAGARSLLVSHWKVDDRVTADMMSKIFLLMQKNPKLSHGEALQQAILAVLDNARSDEERNPRLWAPFVVVGEPAKPN
jgi:CHAT domain-containing protein/tetratricopeptide (TPR) repeat protein